MRTNKFQVGQLGRPEETAQPNWLPNWIAFVIVGAVSLVILLLGEGLVKANSIRLNSGSDASGSVATSSKTEQASVGYGVMKGRHQTVIHD
jgi:hypothetical protein